MPHGTVVDPRVFVAIAPDGTVTIVAHRSEMGTGVAHQPADDRRRRAGGRLGARVASRRRPATRRKYGNQDTDGSRSMRHYLMPMRQMRRRRRA